MRCPRCGAENPERKIVCRKCGARLRPVPAAPSPVTQETSTQLLWRLRWDLIRVGAVFAVSAAVALALGLFVLR
ncbi:MAG: hypothetical protein C4303_06985 [candidate division GAL15 bacterium]